MGAAGGIVDVLNGNWGATSLSAIRAVLEASARVLCGAFGHRPATPVRVSPWGLAPRVVSDRRPHEIRLSARDTYWCQYAYEFSHELCHVLANFDRIRQHRHKWFEEALCELASLFVLHRLSDIFRATPPAEVLSAAAFAPHFATYARRVTDDAEPVSRTELPEWLSKHLPKLEEDPVRRDSNRVVAVALLDSFLRDDSLWRDCGFLNQWDAAADPAFVDHLDSWADCVREHGLVPRTPGLVRATLVRRPRRVS